MISVRSDGLFGATSERIPFTRRLEARKSLTLTVYFSVLVGLITVTRNSEVRKTGHPIGRGGRVPICSHLLRVADGRCSQGVLEIMIK